MRRFLRKLKSALGLATIWTGFGAVAGAVISLVDPFFLDRPWSWTWVLSTVRWFAAVGFFGGLTFSFLLSWVQSRSKTALTEWKAGALGAAVGTLAWAVLLIRNGVVLGFDLVLHPIAIVSLALYTFVGAALAAATMWFYERPTDPEASLEGRLAPPNPLDDLESELMAERERTT